jgi:hypothetical protein
MIDLNRLREYAAHGRLSIDPKVVLELLDMLEAAQKDAARLLYATKDYDGFEHVKLDKYDYATECMEEAGRDEPNAEDELNGVRRLIDAAMQSEVEQ